VRLGLSVPAAVGVLYGVDIILGGAAIGMSQLGDAVRVVGMVAIVALGCLAAVPLARVPVREANESRESPREGSTPQGLPTTTTTRPEVAVRTASAATVGRGD